jgi:competence ComEA-like helix-hairpin-helix protein
MIWTRRQRAGLALVGLAIGMLLAWRWRQNPALVPDPQPPRGDRAAELPGGIDPNTADAATLSAIPGVGKALAQQIVDYRDQKQRAEPGQTVFRSIEDLTHVRGIGEATAERLSAYLVLPDEGRTP